LWEAQFILDSSTDLAILNECVSHEANWQKARLLEIEDIEVAIIREKKVPLVEI
jgi:hypothetical protein